MRVLFAASEVYPLAKTGGLADVSAALAGALRGMGVDLRLIMPGYPRALDLARDLAVVAEQEAARILLGRTPDTGVPIYLIDAPGLFRRNGHLYCDESGEEWPDNAERFARLSCIASDLARGALVSDWKADVVHANDWHTGLLPLFLRGAEGTGRPPVIFTIHNLAFQGLFPLDRLAGPGMPGGRIARDDIEFYGRLSFLKAGLRFADRLTTVSPTYATEILTAEHGCGLDGLLRERSADLVGILNGVDYGIWDPAHDGHLRQTFSAADMAGKRYSKLALQAELGLEVTAAAPLLVFLSRITEQKMADVLASVIPRLVERGAQLAILGEGQKALETALLQAASRHPGRVAVRIGYEEPLAHRMQAGGDILLAPARFEPCGLCQIYALRYGALPIVRATGGLVDTVTAATREAIGEGEATGFVFTEPTAEAMLSSIDEALALYSQPIVWRGMQRRAMSRDFGWPGAAGRYLELYGQLAERGVLHPVPLDERARERMALRGRMNILTDEARAMAG